jgi:hypothetical protein
MTAAQRSTRHTNALIDASGDLIRATVLLIIVPRTLMPSTAQLIASTRKLSVPPGDLIHATASLIAPL